MFDEGLVYWHWNKSQLDCSPKGAPGMPGNPAGPPGGGIPGDIPGS